MRKKINLLVLANAIHSVESYRQVASSLKKQGFEVNVLGLSPRKWNESKFDNVGTSFTKHKYKYYEIPRINYKTEKLVTGKKYKNQFKKSIDTILNFLENILKKEKVDVFVTDGDRHIPILISKYLSSRGIPTVLIDHGLGNGFSYALVYKNIIRKKIIDASRLIFYKIPTLLKKQNDFEAFLDNPRIKLFGENEKCFLCSFCKINSSFYKKYEVNTNNIFDTGYPYFDKVYQESFKEKKIGRKTKKVLFVSTGFGIWKKELGEDFYNKAESFKTMKGKNLDIFVRLKPGEKFPSERKSVKFDDNRIMSYKAVRNYDLVVGDASMVLLEALLLKKPVVILRNKKAVLVDKIVLEVWRKYLDVIAVDDAQELKNVLKIALSRSYQLKIYENFLKYKNEILNGFDGKAASRVAKVILKAAGYSKST